MQVVPFEHTSFGADVVDVDLAALDDEDFAEVYDAWLDRAVLRVRDQRLDREALQNFSRRFGPLEYAPFGKITREELAKIAHPYVTVISNIVQDGRPIGGLGAAEARWHTQSAGTAGAPPAGRPRGGGRTPPPSARSTRCATL